MKGFVLTAALLLGLGTPALAQRRDAGTLPTSVTSDVARIYNDPGTTRRHGATTIARDSAVGGALAVRSGPVTIAGTVRGALLVINGDVVFEPGARVEGDVLVVGGRIDGRDNAAISGDLRVYAEALRYRMSDEDLLVEDDAGRPLRTGEEDEDDFWHRGSRDSRTRFDFLTIVGGNTYNRVEGLPILLGPRYRLRRDWGTLSVQARGIVRTAEPIAWDRGTLGHDARAELRWGHGAGLGIGAAAFDRIDPVEAWQYPDREAGWATFLVHRDFRDFYGRHGQRAFVKAYLNGVSSVTIGYGEEKWGSRATRDPWTLFRDNAPWRPNPAIDEGSARLTTAAFSVDSRNQEYAPGSGWYVQADIELGRLTPSPQIVGGVEVFSPDRDYRRGFLDVRRYNRLGPNAQFNVRAVLGGWLSGDALPLSRRLSVGGPGTLPGYDFRRHWRGGEDRLQCSESTLPQSSLPALCDRVALLQLEYRGALSWQEGERRTRRWLPDDFHTPTWLIFADAGRGWRAKTELGSTYSIEDFPSLNTFKTDVGFGLDFGSMSIALAKAVADPKEPLNVVVRLSRRF